MLSHGSFIRVHKINSCYGIIASCSVSTDVRASSQVQKHHTEVKRPTCSNDPIVKKHFGFGATCRPYMYYMPKTFDSFSWNWSKNICPLRGFSFLFFETNMLVPSTYHYTQTWRVKLLFVLLYLFNKCRVQIASKYSNRDYLFFQKRWKKTYGRL